MISQKTIQEIKDQSSDQIEYLLEELGFENIHENGTDIRARCLVHGGNNDTSFAFNPEKQCWVCFAEGCHEGKSDIFGLVSAALHINFYESVNWLSNKLKI